MPSPKDSNYVNKPFMLNLDKPEELELYEWLMKLPKRSFKVKTKEYWTEQMKKEKENGK